MGFSRIVKAQALAASARHCCSCHQWKGRNIEVHHIIQESKGGPNSFENAIPLCFDCHANAGHYNVDHPKGIKYSPEELRLSRDNWYKLVSSGLLPNFTFIEYFENPINIFQDVERFKQKAFRNQFEHDLIAFTSQEKIELARIFNELLIEKSALIEGDPAIGKTFYSLEIASHFRNLGYYPLYHTFKITDFSEKEIIQNIKSLKDERVLLILDDCHLKIDLASRIKYHFVKPELSICFLFLSRRTSKRRQISETFGSNFLDEFTTNSFDVDCYTPSKKVEVIIQKYKKYYTKKHGKPYFVNNNTKICRHVGSNLIALKAYLELWEKYDTLSKVGKDNMLKAFYDRAYMAYSDRAAECLNIYLSLSYFEFSFEPIPQYRMETEQFESQGLVLRSTNTLYFEHSKTARLYLESYFMYSDTKPKSKYENIETFCLENIKTYLRLFKEVNYPNNVNEIVNFFLNGKKTDKFILTDPELKEIVFNYYRHSTNIDEILYFLNKVAFFIPSSFQFHFEQIVLSRPIKSMVTSDGMFAYYYASISRHLRKRGDTYFQQIFNENDVLTFFKNSKLVAFKQGIQLLDRIEKGYSSNILSKFSLDDILAKCITTRFGSLTDSLRVLSKYIPKLIAELIPKLINSDSFHSNIRNQSIRLINLIDFLDFLKSCEKNFPERFLRRAKFKVSGLASSLIKQNGKAFLRFIHIYLEFSREDAETLISNAPDEVVLHLYKRVPEYQPSSFIFKIGLFICLHLKGFREEAKLSSHALLENMEEVRSKLDLIQYIHLLDMISTYYDPSYFITELDKHGYPILLKKLGNLKSWVGIENSLETLEKLVPGQRQIVLDWMKTHKRP